MQEYAPVFLYCTVFMSVWVIVLMITNRRKSAHLKLMAETWTPVRGLLGPPLEAGRDFDNDMLIWVCRDFLALRLESSGSIKKYYPPEEVVKRMQLIADYLAPYESELQELGWHHVPWFIKDALLSTDSAGRKFVRASGSNDWETVAVLSETAGVLSHFGDPDCISSDIAKAVEVQRKYLDE
jgi:hypothetical protein